MITRLNVASIYVLDKDEALDFYVNKLGLEKGNDVRQGDYRWLTIRVPGEPGTEVSLEQPGPPLHDEATAAQLRELITKGALGGLVFITDDARGLYETLKERGVTDFTQEPTDHFYGTDMGLRDPFGNPIRILQQGKAGPEGAPPELRDARRRRTLTMPTKQATEEPSTRPRRRQGLHRGGTRRRGGDRPRAEGRLRPQPGRGTRRGPARTFAQALAKMPADDRAMGERIHEIVVATPPRRSFRRPTTACRPTPPRARTARSSPSSSPSRSSRSATRRSASSPTRSLDDGADVAHRVRGDQADPEVEKQIAELIKKAAG